MEILTNTNRERLISIAENYINDILEDRGNSNIEDLASAFANAGFTKSEFFQILDKYYLNDYTWAEETKSAPIPTAKEVSVGDSDRAILETALTQIGIEYEYHDDDEDVNWIEIKDTDTDNWSVEIHFDNDGRFLRVRC